MDNLASVLHTFVSVVYQNTDISKDVYEDLLNISYTDKIEDEGDELTVTLKDETGKWAGSWSPERGAKITATFETESRGCLATDTMIVDSLKTSGSPRIFELSAVSIPLDNTIRRELKTRNFENISLKTLGQQIADEAGLKFFFDCEDVPEYDRLDQKRESDLALLQRLCKDAGLSVKVSAQTCIIFDQKSYESKKAVKTYNLGTSPILNWSFQAQQSQRYKACTVKWRDTTKRQDSNKGGSSTQSAQSKIAVQSSPVAVQADTSNPDIFGSNNVDTKSKKISKAKSKKGNQKQKVEDQDYTYTDDSVEESGQTYVLKKRCCSLKEAERLAKATLRKLNLRQTTGSLSVVGDPLMVAGSVIELTGFGSFDGNFIIERAEHSMGPSGYVTSLDVRRVNNTY
jgi:phage protein D